MLLAIPDLQSRRSSLCAILPIFAFIFLVSTPSTCSMNRLDYLRKTRIYRTMVQHPVAAVLVTALSSYGLYHLGKQIFKKGKPLLMRTRFGFHVSRLYNKLRYGTDFTFNRMAGDPKVQEKQDLVYRGNNFFVSYEPQKIGANRIRSINDGKQTPLVLGAIPSEQDHIDQLKRFIGNRNQDKPIGLYTLNENWEYAAAGLHELVAKNKGRVFQNKYPTPDFDTPSLIDLLRAVRDLNNRDNQSIALVHCKAGRGRSATVIAAYLVHITQAAGYIASLKQIEAYLIARRHQVSLNEKQKKTLTNFIRQLSTAKSFEALCKQYEKELKERDAQAEELTRSDTQPASPSEYADQDFAEIAQTEDELSLEE